jgi:hypothetical protein
LIPIAILTFITSQSIAWLVIPHSKLDIGTIFTIADITFNANIYNPAFLHGNFASTVSLTATFYLLHRLLCYSRGNKSCYTAIMPSIALLVILCTHPLEFIYLLVFLIILSAILFNADHIREIGKAILLSLVVFFALIIVTFLISKSLAAIYMSFYSLIVVVGILALVILKIIVSIKYRGSISLLTLKFETMIRYFNLVFWSVVFILGLIYSYDANKLHFYSQPDFVYSGILPLYLYLFITFIPFLISILALKSGLVKHDVEEFLIALTIVTIAIKIVTYINYMGLQIIPIIPQGSFALERKISPTFLYSFSSILIAKVLNNIKDKKVLLLLTVLVLILPYPTHIQAIVFWSDNRCFGTISLSGKEIADLNTLFRLNETLCVYSQTYLGKLITDLAGHYSIYVPGEVDIYTLQKLPFNAVYRRLGDILIIYNRSSSCINDMRSLLLLMENATIQGNIVVYTSNMTLHYSNMSMPFTNRHCSYAVLSKCNGGAITINEGTTIFIDGNLTSYRFSDKRLFIIRGAFVLKFITLLPENTSAFYIRGNYTFVSTKKVSLGFIELPKLSVINAGICRMCKKP